MKVSAWRDDLDIEDARLLPSKMAGDKETIWGQVQPYAVPVRELKSQCAFDVGLAKQSAAGPALARRT